MVETGDGERETRDERRETCRRYLTLPCLTVLLSCSGFRLRTVQCFTVTGLDRCNTHSYYKVSTLVILPYSLTFSLFICHLHRTSHSIEVFFRLGTGNHRSSTIRLAYCLGGRGVPLVRTLGTLAGYRYPDIILFTLGSLNSTIERTINLTPSDLMTVQLFPKTATYLMYPITHVEPSFLSCQTTVRYLFDPFFCRRDSSGLSIRLSQVRLCGYSTLTARIPAQNYLNCCTTFLCPCTSLRPMRP